MVLSVNIKKKLPGFELEVDFETESGISGILGASGAGKSITLRCIAGLDEPDSGRIVLDKHVLYDSERGVNVSIRRRKTGILFQSYALFPHMTVEENIGFGLDTLPQLKRISRIKEKIEMMQLEGLEKRYPYQISGGQQQRVALARALAVEPEVLLLDEPFSALDEQLRDQTINQLLVSLAQFSGVVLFVTHNVEEAYRICSNLIILSNGKVEAHGNKEKLFEHPPNLATAQITSCKNISRARRISDKLLEALDWNCMLELENIPENVTHVGLQARYITLAYDEGANNIFHCWPAFTSETPFRVTNYLSLGKPPSEAGDYNIQWELNRDEWHSLKKMPLPWKVRLTPEKVFCMTGR